MTARFMSDTPYAGTEQEMQRIPGFHSRGTGIAVSHFRYSAKDCDCRLCAYKSRKRKCEKADGCICLRERLVAGCVPFEELLERLTAEVTVSPFVSRVAHLSMQSHPCFSLPVTENGLSLYGSVISEQQKKMPCVPHYIFCLQTDSCGEKQYPQSNRISSIFKRFTFTAWI